MTNPFAYGTPTSGPGFVGREAELARVLSRIRADGQATALVGEPGIGKTSLLGHLAHHAAALDSRGSGGERLVFSYVDAHTLTAGAQAPEIWATALAGLEDMAPDVLGDGLVRALALAEEQGHPPRRVERVLSLAQRARLRLVLVVDEFDALTHDEDLGRSGFFGALRSLASRYPALALVLASHFAVDQIHDRSRAYHRGSPILNFVDELTLGTLEDADSQAILAQAGDAFDDDDRRFVHRVAGGYPLLVKAAACEHWTRVAQGPHDDPERRRQDTGQRVRDLAARTLNANWQVWSPASRRAFAVVALTNLNAAGHRLAGSSGPSFDVARFVRDLDTLRPELRSLTSRGILEEDLLQPGGLRVRADALLWWFADKAVEVARPELPLDEWLRAHQLEGVWRHDEQALFKAAVVSAFGVLRSGATTLIDAAARGLGTAAVAGITG